MEQHHVRHADRRQVVAMRNARGLLSQPAGGSELVEVVEGELGDWFAGLDQQPRRHLRPGREARASGEPELLGFVKELVDPCPERAGLDLPPERRQLP